MPSGVDYPDFLFLVHESLPDGCGYPSKLVLGFAMDVNNEAADIRLLD